ncbi:MAG: hypothetical protein WD492_16445 [Alkalispirochaeta sp.]
MPTIEWPTARDNGHVSTVEERLNQVLPSESYYLKSPDGSNARSDQGIDTLRASWAKELKLSTEELKKRAQKRQKLTYKTNVSINTIRRNAAEGLGIPAAAIELQKPDGTRPKMTVQLSTFRGYWAGKK